VAQPKAGNIAGCITVCAEVNPKNYHIRHSQGWVNEVIEDLMNCLKSALRKPIMKSFLIGYLGNIVDVWEKFDQENIHSI
jgi:urocanate hydratase